MQENGRALEEGPARFPAYFTHLPPYCDGLVGAQHIRRVLREIGKEKLRFKVLLNDAVWERGEDHRAAVGRETHIFPSFW